SSDGDGVGVLEWSFGALDALGDMDFGLVFGDAPAPFACDFMTADIPTGSVDECGAFPVVRVRMAHALLAFADLAQTTASSSAADPSGAAGYLLRPRGRRELKS